MNRSLDLNGEAVAVLTGVCMCKQIFVCFNGSQNEKKMKKYIAFQCQSSLLKISRFVVLSSEIAGQSNFAGP